MRLLDFSLVFLFCIFCSISALAQNVIVVVIDGARYSETFGAGSVYVPHLWNDLKPLGTLYTSFRINSPGKTETVPGHAAAVTGTWQPVSNDINGVPTRPTVFEYFRREDGHAQSTCYLVVGKSKLAAVAYSSYTGYGASYGACVSAGELSDDQVYRNLDSVMDVHHPKLIVVNLPSVDRAGHTGNWTDYLAAITHADILIYQLWQKIQSDSYYSPGNTTLFVTNDHGRHTTAFQNHGDDCEGCQRIMLLVCGRGVTPNQVIPDTRYQIDIAPTIADLLDFTPVYAVGTSLFDATPPLPIQLSSFTARVIGANNIRLEWETMTELNNYGFEVQKSFSQTENYVTIPNSFVPGHGTTIEPHSYSFTDTVEFRGLYWYRLKQIDLDGTVHYSDGISINVLSGVGDGELPLPFSLHQNYPNPFNPSTQITFALREPSFVTLRVHNVLGQEMATLVDGEMAAGYHNLQWNGRDRFGSQVSSGGYFYRINAEQVDGAASFTSFRKMLILK